VGDQPGAAGPADPRHHSQPERAMTLSTTHYVGLYLPSDPSVYPPPLGFAYIDSTATPQEYTATLTAPLTPATYSVRLRNSTDVAVSSLLVQPVVVAAPVAASMTITSPVPTATRARALVQGWGGDTTEYVALYLPGQPSIYPPPLRL